MLFRSEAIRNAQQAKERREMYGINATMHGLGLDQQQAEKQWEVATQAQTSRDVANITGGYSLAGHELSGKYSLLGHALSAMGKDRLTTYQELKLRMDAERQVDPAMSRQEYAKSLNLSSVPKPGEIGRAHV